MYNGELLVALVLGISLSLIFADALGIIPAGIIVPSFLALVFDQPIVLAGIIIIAVLAYVSVEFIGKYIILFGRRKFAALIIMTLFIKIVLIILVNNFQWQFITLQGMGLIIPGLIANSFDRQGVVPTMVSMFFLGGLTYLGVLGYIVWA